MSAFVISIPAATQATSAAVSAPASGPSSFSDTLASSMGIEPAQSEMQVAKVETSARQEETAEVNRIGSKANSTSVSVAESKAEPKPGARSQAKLTTDVPTNPAIAAHLLIPNLMAAMPTSTGLVGESPVLFGEPSALGGKPTGVSTGAQVASNTDAAESVLVPVQQPIFAAGQFSWSDSVAKSIPPSQLGHAGISPFPSGAEGPLSVVAVPAIDISKSGSVLETAVGTTEGHGAELLPFSVNGGTRAEEHRSSPERNGTMYLPPTGSVTTPLSTRQSSDPATPASPAGAKGIVSDPDPSNSTTTSAMVSVSITKSVPVSKDHDSIAKTVPKSSGRFDPSPAINPKSDDERMNTSAIMTRSAPVLSTQPQIALRAQISSVVFESVAGAAPADAIAVLQEPGFTSSNSKSDNFAASMLTAGKPSSTPVLPEPSLISGTSSQAVVPDLSRDRASMPKSDLPSSHPSGLFVANDFSPSGKFLALKDATGDASPSNPKSEAAASAAAAGALIDGRERKSPSSAETKPPVSLPADGSSPAATLPVASSHAPGSSNGSVAMPAAALPSAASPAQTPVDGTPPLPRIHQMLDAAPPAPVVAIPGPLVSADVPMSAQMHVGMRTDAFGAVEIHTVVQQSQVGITVHSDRDLARWFSSEVPSLESGLNHSHLNLTAVDFGSGRSGVQTSTSFQQGQPQQSFSQRQTPGSATVTFPVSEKNAAKKSTFADTSGAERSIRPDGIRVSIRV